MLLKKHCNGFSKVARGNSILLVLLIAFHCTQAQFIEPGKFVDGNFPAFSPEAIKANLIKEITIRKMRKPSGEPIYDDGVRYIYHFDGEGRLTTFKHVFEGYRHRSDTIIRRYGYTEGHVQFLETQHGKYVKRIAYHWTSDTFALITRKVRRGTGDWELLSSEQMSISNLSTSDGQLTTEWLGGIDAKPYQRAQTQYNAKKLPIYHEIRVGARLHIEEHWDYSEEFVSNYERTDHQENQSLEVSYRYHNGTAEEGNWCKNGHCREWSLVLNDKGLPKGWLFMQEVSQNLEIWEFRYVYY